jgi:hypothetical protein
LSTANDPIVRMRELDGRTLFVVDGLFDPQFMSVLCESLIRLPYTLTDYDHEEVSHIRHWKFDFDVKDFPANVVLRSWRERVVAKTSELAARQLVLQRLYCNNVLYGDHLHVHDDGCDLTALHYTSIDWQEDWHGETIFYELSGEAYHAVAPRPGRLVIFPGDIPPPLRRPLADLLPASAVRRLQVQIRGHLVSVTGERSRPAAPAARRNGRVT